MLSYLDMCLMYGLFQALGFVLALAYISRGNLSQDGRYNTTIHQVSTANHSSRRIDFLQESTSTSRYPSQVVGWSASFWSGNNLYCFLLFIHYMIAFELDFKYFECQILGLFNYLIPRFLNLPGQILRCLQSTTYCIVQSKFTVHT